MMIVGARSYGSIVKLLVCMLVFLGFNSINISYAACDFSTPGYDPASNTCPEAVVIPFQCPSGQTPNARGNCVTDIQPIQAKDPKEITTTLNFDCKTNPNQIKCTNAETIGVNKVKELDTNLGNKDYKQALNDCMISGKDRASCPAIALKAKTDAEKIEKCIATYGEKYCTCKLTLKGIYLNTEVPFVGAPGNPRCLVLDGTGGGATTVLQSLTKILMTFVMIGGFGMIVWGGVQIAAGDVKGGKEKIIGVVIAFALLGSLGVILRFINPNFFS